MKRRDFLKSLTAVGVSTALPFSLVAKASKSAINAESALLVNTQQLFNDALASNPELIGFANVEADFPPRTLDLEGDIPKDLRGMYVRNGPAKHERQERRYKHLFEGDGMLQQFVFADGKISHQGKFINTPKFNNEERAQKFLYSGPDSKFNDSLPVSSADQVNTANTNVIAVNNELWALWEGGSATAVDKQNLSFKQHVNLGKETVYGDKLKGLPFSAHPKVDINGDIWNFGLNPSGHIVLYHLQANGKLKKVKLLNTQYRGGMLHDFLITQHHILLILPSLNRKSGEKGMFSSIEFDKNQAMQVLVVEKNTLEQTKRYELPPGFVFHFGNAWEDRQNNIHFDASLYPNVDVLHELSDVMSGNSPSMPTHAYTTLFTLMPDGAVKQHAFKDISEFPRVCEHLTGTENRYLFHTSSKPKSLWSNAIVSHDLKSETTKRYEYSDNFLVEEHVPVCPTREEGKGYLIGTALHVPSKRTCLNIFKMTSIEEGPIARAWLPYHLPLGFHGNFIQS